MEVKLSNKRNFSGMVRLADLKSKIETQKAELEGANLEKAGKEPTTSAEEFEGRNGYDPTFLDSWKIKLPKGPEKDELMLKRGGKGVELKYQNFSVVMSKSRRMPLLTAVNIMGNDSKKAPRTSIWSFDGRIDKDDQWGDEIYDNNILDRGHMVRREDPIWGPEFSTANLDTFHFTNSCPQIAGVNQVIWLGLENYILKNARVHELMATVFTGPIFNKKDIEYRGAKIPAAFWKVVCMVQEDGTPSATAYKVSQKEQLADLEFVYSSYKTFQISIQQVMKETSIDFTDLLQYDGFTQLETAAGGQLEIALENFGDIRNLVPLQGIDF